MTNYTKKTIGVLIIAILAVVFAVLVFVALVAKFGLPLGPYLWFGLVAGIFLLWLGIEWSSLP